MVDDEREEIVSSLQHLLKDDYTKRSKWEKERLLIARKRDGEEKKEKHQKILFFSKLPAHPAYSD